MSEIIKYIKEEKLEKYEDIYKYFSMEPFRCKLSHYKQLYMICFNNEKYAELENLNPIKSFLKNCTGVIFERNTNRLIHYSFCKSYDDIISKDLETEEDIKNKMLINKKYYDITDYYELNNLNSEDYVMDVQIYNEGSVIKLYYYNDAWNVSTSKIINAKNAKWKSVKNYHHLFNDVVNELYETSTNFYESLDKDYAYTYILQHPENNRCFNNVEYNLILVSKVNTNEKSEYYMMEDVSTEELTYYKLDYSLEKLIELQKNGNESDNYIIKFYPKKDLVDNHVKVDSITKIKMLSTKYKILQYLVGNYNNTDDTIFNIVKNYSLSDKSVIDFYLANNTHKFNQIYNMVLVFINHTKELLKHFNHKYVKHPYLLDFITNNYTDTDENIIEYIIKKFNTYNEFLEFKYNLKEVATFNKHNFKPKKLTLKDFIKVPTVIIE